MHGETQSKSIARLRADEAVQRVCVRHRKRGQEIGTEAEFEIAAFGQLDRILDEFRQVGEQRGHFLRRFEVLLRQIVARAFRIGEDTARVDANTRLMRLEIFTRDEAHVVAGDDRKIQFRGQL